MTRFFPRLLSLLLSLSSLALVACGDDGGTSDAATDTPADTSTDTASDMSEPEHTTWLQLGDLDLSNGDINPSSATNANYACIGERTQPTPGAEVNFELQLREFRTDNVLDGLCVSFYDDNMVIAGDTCDGFLTTDDEGVVPVSGHEGGWYAYHVYPKDGPSAELTIAGSVQVNQPAPADGARVEGNSISQATLNLIPTILGFQQRAGTAIVAGTAMDCDGAPVYGAQLRLFRESGEEILDGTSPTAPRFRYFDGDEFPKADQPWTHVDGLFATANVPTTETGEFVYAELWGALEEGGEPEMVACERLPIFSDTVSIINLYPTRGDAPSCPGL